jgi:TonB-linked SusC/RagA family outer membrane protein
MKKFTMLFVCLAMLGIQLVSAQPRTITGNVTSAEEGMSLPGVSVSVKGTTLGTITDVDGNYSLEVSAEAKTLVFSFVGMKTQEVGIGSQSVINVALTSDVIGVEEVIIVAYGSSTREAKTGSVSQIGSAQIADKPVTSIDKVLSGKMAGVSVTANSGQPGASSQIRIRGTSSINAGSEPLYVIDGVPVMSGNQTYFTNTGNAIASLNPNDIETITILKDAAAASIYGSRAANGVILITTKKGSKGKSTLTGRAKFGISQLANDNDYGVMNPVQLVDYMRAASKNAGYNPDDPAAESFYVPYELLSRPQTNWMDEFTRTGKNREYELSSSGGNDKTQYFASGLMHKSEGVFYGIDYSKLTFRTNVNHEINDKLKLSTNINAGYTEANDVAMQSLFYVNPIFAGNLILPWTPFRDEYGNYNLSIPENNNTNPRATAEYDDQFEKQYRFLGNAALSYEPIKNLTLKTTNSAELTTSEGRRYWSPEADYAGEATLQVNSGYFRQLITSNTARYANSINDEHTFSILAGQEATIFDYNMYYIYSPDVNPQIPFPNTAAADQDQGNYFQSSNTMLSFFGMVDYNYQGKYYIQASLRRDGSSRFGSDTKWGTFYSVGLSWNLHKESFLESMDFIDLLKLRGSYGTNGNNQIGNYDQYGTYASVEYNGVVGMGPTRPSNPDLMWEKNVALNIGIDFNFLTKISGNIDVYQRTTTDMLLDRPLSMTSGFSSMRQNIGELSNKGIEFQINYDILNGPVEWTMGGNIAFNKSEILDLGGEDQIQSGISSRIFHIKGERLFTYYLYDYYGVNPINGEALWVDDDGNLTNNYNKARRINAGSPEPIFAGGLTSNLKYKGFSLDIALEFKYGNKVSIEENRYLASDGYEWGSNQSTLVLDYWKEPGDITKTPKPIAKNPTNSNGFISSRWMQDGSYTRIKDITLAYSIPKSVVDKLKVGNIRVYGSALNLYTFHNVDYWDPERGVEGAGFGIYPMTKTMVFGIDVTF